MTISQLKSACPLIRLTRPELVAVATPYRFWHSWVDPSQLSRIGEAIPLDSLLNWPAHEGTEPLNDHLRDAAKARWEGVFHQEGEKFL
jgi:hypothetical protein